MVRNDLEVNYMDRNCPISRPTRYLAGVIEAVLWDFGGVISSSPFEAFGAYEREAGLPNGLIRQLNATNPDTNAWSQLERNAVDTTEFCRLFEAEAAALGFIVDAQRVLGALQGEIRPAMVEAIRRCREQLKVACLTNNFVPLEERPRDPVYDLFHIIVESSKVGVRKPELRFYEMACELLEVEPRQCVFLDDLGINLKPAKAMGMTTIKVEDPHDALRRLEDAVGFPLL